VTKIQNLDIIHVYEMNKLKNWKWKNPEKKIAYKKKKGQEWILPINIFLTSWIKSLAIKHKQNHLIREHIHFQTIWKMI
jgi:hypothetical protein